MKDGITILERVQEDSLEFASESAGIIKNSLVETTIRAIVEDLEILHPHSTYIASDSITVLIRSQVGVLPFFCGIVTADPDNFNIRIEDGRIHLCLSDRVVPGTELFVWLILQRVIQQFKLLMENPFLLNATNKQLVDLTSY